MAAFLGNSMEMNGSMVNPHTFLQGRERACRENAEDILGRQEGDSEKLFPKHTRASAAALAEFTVNGRVLKRWTYAQLETLNATTLRQRARDLRDAVGEGNCPPMPSGQIQDLARWIVHMQSELTREEPQPGRTGAVYGDSKNTVPPSYMQETRERPITMDKEMERPQPSNARRVPFGPRAGHCQDAGRDHINDLKYQLNEFKEAPNGGAPSSRSEGRRRFAPRNHMESQGISSAAPQGLETLRSEGEGRRYLECEDHMLELMEQKSPRATEALEPAMLFSARSPRKGGGVAGAAGAPTEIAEFQPHITDSCMTTQGVSDPPLEQPIGGERRRHKTDIKCHFLNTGTSETNDQVTPYGRRHFDSFSKTSGSRPHSSFGETQDAYHSSWKQDPSKLRGVSMII
jgi:hypothetical protein